TALIHILFYRYYVSLSLSLIFFFFKCYADHRDLHSFPTRRSSDLVVEGKIINYLIDHNLTATATYTINQDLGGTVTVGQNLNTRSEEHTSELQSRGHLVCRLLLEKKKRFRSTQSSSTRFATGSIVT